MNEVIGKEEIRKSFSEEEKGRLLKEFEESQGTMSDFCRGKGIALTTFSGWLRRKRGGVPVLAEVKMEMPLSYQTLEIRFPNRIEASIKISSMGEFKGIMRSLLTC